MPDAAFDNIPGENAELEIHVVQPGYVYRGEIKGESASVRDPFKNLMVFMRTEIVRNNINVFARVVPIQTLEKSQELLVGVPVNASSLNVSSVDREGPQADKGRGVFCT